MKKNLIALMLLVVVGVLVLEINHRTGATDELRDTSTATTEIRNVNNETSRWQKRVIELNGETRRVEYSIGYDDLITSHRYVIGGTAYKLDPSDQYADPLSFRIEYGSKNDLDQDPLVALLNVDIAPLVGKSWIIDPEHPHPSGWIYFSQMKETTYDLTFYVDRIDAEEAGSAEGVLLENMVDREMTVEETSWVLSTVRSLTEQLRTE